MVDIYKDRKKCRKKGPQRPQKLSSLKSLKIQPPLQKNTGMCHQNQ